MLSRPPSVGMLRRLNRRQRKKLRVGEFRELVFEVRMIFRHPLDEPAHAALLNAFIDLVESRGLIVGGLGGRLPLDAADGIVAAGGRDSPSDADWQAVVAWLQQRPEIATAEAGEFFDGGYDTGERPAGDESLVAFMHRSPLVAADDIELRRDTDFPRDVKFED